MSRYRTTVGGHLISKMVCGLHGTEVLRQELHAITRKYVEANKHLHEMSKEDTKHVEELRKKFTAEQLDKTYWAAFG